MNRVPDGPSRTGKAADVVFSLFAPPYCRHCRAPLWNHDAPFLCRACAEEVAWLDDKVCRACGYPVGPHARPVSGCRECRRLRLNLSAAAAVARYTKGARSLVLAFKFAGEVEVAKALGAMMAARLAAVEFPVPDAVAPVASYPARLRRRGFDPAAMLAGEVAARSGFRFEPRLLTRVRDTAPQSTLPRRERLVNVGNAFRAGRDLRDATVLLVDDVMTTGATMADCARACREAGARRVYALLFAR